MHCLMDSLRVKYPKDQILPSIKVINYKEVHTKCEVQKMRKSYLEERIGESWNRKDTAALVEARAALGFWIMQNLSDLKTYAA